MYIIDVPTNYNPNNAYKLIFGFHPLGGKAEDIAGSDGYYKLKPLANDTAIFVAPNGIDNGWANYGDRDLKFTRAMVDLFNGQFCIDTSRIFSVGWSFGGMMSFTLGCQASDLFRAIAPMSGALLVDCPAEGKPRVAAWISHGIYDDFVKYADGQKARDAIVARNHCSNNTVPTDPDPCVSYQGCDAGYPITWCAFAGGHGTPDFFPGAIWKFFSQF